jgi:glycosyltransferase involved in cell wall biosynthesis
MGIVSALVCTRDRPDSLCRTIRSLLNGDDASFEVVVMDQSDGPGTEQALQEFRDDPRLRYVRTPTRGKGAGLNAGLRLARGNVVACTDDDCETPPGWVSQMAAVIAAQPTAAVVFCNVHADPYDPATGYVPAYVRRSDRLLRTIGDARNGLGLGAGMALRREAVLAFGGFDEALGPGSRFRSGDDWDISVRALLGGWHVYETAAVSVLHHGFRTMAEGRVHALRDWIAIGALCAKPIRAGRLSVTPLALWLFFVDALWPPVRDVLHLKRPSGLSRIVGFVRGFAEGIRTPVDRETLLFRPGPGLR